MYITLILSQGLIALVGYILHLLDFKYWSEEGYPTGILLTMAVLHYAAFCMWLEGNSI